MSQCCWATAPAASARPPTSPWAATPTRWRWATSTATATLTWSRPTSTSEIVCRCCWAPATASFGAATNFAAGLDPEAVAVGDFNHDGNPDLAVANVSGDNVSVLLGTGNGSFG